MIVLTITINEQGKSKHQTLQRVSQNILHTVRWTLAEKRHGTEMRKSVGDGTDHIVQTPPWATITEDQEY